MNVRRLGSPFVAAMVLAVGTSTAFAEDKLFTVSSIDDGSDRLAGGSVVVDSTGRRFVVKDAFFKELVTETDPITLSAELQSDGKTLEVKWAKAVVTEEIKLADGKKLKPGVELKVTGRTQKHDVEAEEVYSRWRVTLPGGASVRLDADDEYSISLESPDAKVAGALTQGVVTKDASGALVLERPDGVKLKLVGASAKIVETAVGRFVEGYGLSYSGTGEFEFTQVHGATTSKVRARKTTASSSTFTVIDKFEKVSLVNAKKPGFFTIRINWPGVGSQSGVRQAFVKTTDVVVGSRFLVLEGVVSKKEEAGETVYTIKGANETFRVASGTGSFAVEDSVLESSVGKTVRTGGRVLERPSYERGQFQMQWLEAVVTRDVPKKEGSPAVAKGTVVRIHDIHVSILDPDAYRVVLPDGKAAALVKEDVAVGSASATPGVTGVLGTTPH